jgi:diguanylate cyclase (GGDEF)-like protein/PAS domain S-box-containing protein
MNKQPDAAQLRRIAEERLSRLPPVALLEQYTDKVLHELQVHQIELEMQNENLRQVQFELERSRDRYMDFYDFAPVGYVTLNESGQILEINLAGGALLDMARNEILHQPLMTFISPDNRDRWAHHFLHVMASDTPLACDLKLIRKNGLPFFARMDCLRKNRGGGEKELSIVMSDISERIKHEEEIRTLAFYDALTQLPNRRLLKDRLDQAMTSSKRSGHYGALMFIDMDDFKHLNDQHGHDAGDRLLVEVARRITGCLREVDTVSRFGGDEFVVLLGELDSDKTESYVQASVIAEKIRSALSERYVLKAHNKAEIIHYCTSSIGVVLFIGYEYCHDDLLKWADRAMYQAKSDGRNQVNFQKNTEYAAADLYQGIDKRLEIT